MRYFLILILFVSTTQFASSIQTSGRDYKIVFLDPTKSFYSQVSRKNTKYVLSDSFDLNGQKIVMPKNTILEFNGGYLSNGVIYGNETRIISSARQLFDKSLTILGSWGNTEFYPEWYGAIGDGKQDDTEAVQKAINSGVNVLLTKIYKVKHLKIKNTVNIRGGCLKAYLDSFGNTRNIISSNGRFYLSFVNVSFDGNAFKTVKNENGTLEPMVALSNSKNVIFKKCIFYHHSQNSGLPDEIEWQKRNCYAISVLGAEKVLFEECEFHDNFTEQIAVGSNTSFNKRKPFTKLIVRNCVSYNNMNALALFLLFELKSAFITGNIFKDNGRAFFNILSDNVVLKNNHLINTNSRAITSESHGDCYSVEHVIIESNEIINAKEGAISVGNKDVDILYNVIKNNPELHDNEYIIRLGGLLTGDNNESVEAQSALPYYNNSFKQNKKKSGIRIYGNYIEGFSSRAAIMIRVTERIKYGVGTVDIGSLDDITIEKNEISSKNGYPLYFSNGNYSKVIINKNIINVDTPKTIVYMSPSSFSENVKSNISDLLFNNNTVFYSQSLPDRSLIEIDYGITRRVEIKNNAVNIKTINGKFNIKQFNAQ